MSPQKLQLQVIKTESLIHDQAKSIFFKAHRTDATGLNWKAGQHITVILSIDGQEVRRSYSISTAHNRDAVLRITVKRVAGGLVSNYLNDRVEEGDVIDVLAPFGGFSLIPDQQARRTYYFFAAGSGITPLFAMLEAVLNSEPHSVVHLLYGNRNHKTIIFEHALEKLQAAQPKRLTVSYVLSRPSMWSGFKYWQKGLVDQATVTAFIDQHKPYAQDTQYYICGPGGMNQVVKGALSNGDVPDHRIHMESYGAISPDPDSSKGMAARAVIKLGNQIHHISIQAGQTVLAAARKDSIETPYSCESGVCGACKAQLKQGQVYMHATMALTDAEVKSGCILTCQAVAQSKQLAINFE